MLAVLINSMTSGGAEKVVHTLLDQFIIAKVPVHLICLEKEQYYTPQKELVSVSYLSNYETLARSIWKFPIMFLAALKLKKKVQDEGIEIIHCHLLRAMFTSIIAQYLGSPHRSQIILHSRINFDHNWVIIRNIKKWIYKKVLFRASTVISICDTMKNDLDDYLELKNHPDHRRIYNPHNITDIKKQSIQEVTDYPINKKNYLVSVGRLVKGKRIDDLINAFQRINLNRSDLELIIIGNGPMEAVLRSQSRKLKIEDKIHFLGYKTNPYPYIANSSGVVLTSEWEGLPNILIEAMICGVPIVSSDCISGPREILHPDSNLTTTLSTGIEKTPYGILYAVGEIKSLTLAIDEMLLFTTEIQGQLQNGQSRCQHFDAPVIAKRYLD